MSGFDTAVQTFIVNHAAHSAIINHAIRTIAALYLFKGLMLIAALWWIWFTPGERREWAREMVVATIASGFIALMTGRLLAHALPFRERPIYDTSLHLNFPAVGLGDSVMRTWSSFPSDHAMLWFAIATGIFLVWRGIGTLALIYTAVFICAPRVYLGLHYPTDVIAGAVIGIVITWVLTRDVLRARLARPILHSVERFPGPGYMFAFLLSYELITQFDELMQLWHSATKVL